MMNPLGIDTPAPRFSWKMASGDAGILQSAYEITVAAAGETVWDSGRVESPVSIQIPYAGAELAPRTRYEVEIRTWDGAGKPGTPGKAHFETGWGRRRWQGTWINPYGNTTRTESALGNFRLPPVYYLRREFEVKGEVARARLYASSLGMSASFCNGEAVSDELFSPGWTDYYTRVYYRTYDVTALLKPGKNALGVKLASGWYSGRISNIWNQGVPTYGSLPKVRAMLCIDYADGGSEIVGTDKLWRWADTGRERYSEIYDGECCDYRMSLDGFSRPGFDDAAWHDAVECRDSVKMTAFESQPVRRIQTMTPVAVTEPKPGVHIVDFGQNFSGREFFDVALPAGAKVLIRHAEMLQKDGTAYLESLRTAEAATLVIGDGKVHRYEPLFTFFGFRYLEITGDTETLDFGAIRATVIHSDLERTGDFRCSQPQVSQLFRNLVWGQRSNYVDLPTDCPQRDERLGWSADTQVFLRVGSYNYQVGGFLTKYTADLESCRNELGEYPPYAPYPYRRSDMRPTDNGFGAAGWTDAGVICPWEIYRKYADRRMLERHYAAMAEFVRSRKRNSDNLIDSQACYGDWLNIGSPLPPELVGTAHFAHSADLLREFAAILGRKEDEAEFAALFAAIKARYAASFLDGEGRLRTTWSGTKRSLDRGGTEGIPLSCRTQTGAVLSLHFNLLPESSVDAVVRDLVADIESRGTHLSTGFLGTPYLLPVLARFGRLDLAYRLLEQRSYPSWIYSIEQGATTCWERWNSYNHETGFGNVSMNSFNHYAYGAVGDFMYETIAGITPLEPGFRRFAVAPRPGGTLTSARGEYNSEYGRIVSEWRLENGRFVLDVTVPANTECEVSLPNGERQTVGAGSHHYECAC